MELRQLEPAVLLPAGFLDQCPSADAVVVLHSDVYGDCTSGGVFGAEDTIGRSFIHEGGHAVFGLWDEYDDAPGCPTGRGSTDANTWILEADCRAALTAHGLDPDDCHEFTTCGTPSGRWKIDNGQFIMDDGNYFANGWGDASTWWIDFMFSNLGAPPASPLPYPGAEQSLVLDLTVGSGGVTVNDTGITLAPAPNYFPIVYDFTVETFAADGSQLGQYGFDDPRLMQGESDYDGPAVRPVAALQLTIPYHHNIASATNSGDGMLPAVVDLSQFDDGQPGPTPNAGGPYTAYEGSAMILDASSSAGDIVLYDWDLDGDHDIDLQTSQSIDTYVPPDDYSGPVYLRVLDSHGYSSVTMTDLWVVNVAPTVSVGANQTGSAGEAIAFTGSFSDPGSADTHTIEWIWGDGTSTVGSLSETHIYVDQGTYQVVLRVTDDDGGVGEASLTATVHHNSCILGQSVDFRDRVDVQAPVGATSNLHFGEEAFLLGTAVVNGNATLDDRSTVDGDLLLAGALARGSGVTITGDLVEHSGDVQLAALPVYSVNAGSGWVTWSGTRRVYPGTYGNVTVALNARITLGAGNFSIRSLSVQPNARMVIDGPVGLNVQGNVELADRVTVHAATPQALVLYTNGLTCRVGNDAKFSGTIVAPNANVTVGSRVVYQGCVGGNNVEIQPDTGISSGGVVLPIPQ